MSSNDTILIAIEGSDGSGKETQSSMLKKWFTEKGKTVGSVSFPRYK
jgi:thymidylate kinase